MVIAEVNYYSYGKNRDFVALVAIHFFGNNFFATWLDDITFAFFFFCLFNANIGAN